MNKIKPKDFISFYTGCPVIAPSIADVDDWEDFTLHSISPSELKISTYHPDYGIQNWPRKDFKLVLRPLKSMTIEEGAWCLKRTFFNHVEYPISDFKLELVGDKHENPRISINNDWYTNSLTFCNKTGSVWSGNEVAAHSAKISSEIFLFLISNNFDLFGLIESGEAVEQPQEDAFATLLNVNKVKPYDRQ